MATLASAIVAPRSDNMTNVARLDADTAWAAFMRRDRAWDGRVIGAVKTTGIYCKPSCPAKRPKRENVEFFATGDEARAAGFRPCLRCKPDEVGRDREAVAKAVKLIEQAEEVPSLDQLAAAVGYAPHHFQRLFKRDLGVSPAEYARGLRAQRAQAALKANGRVTDAIYDAGYAGPSGFYSDAKERLGMTPSAWRDGGRGETIRWTMFDSPIGTMLIAATSKGICRLTFDDSEQSLKRLFPKATIVKDDGGLRGQGIRTRVRRQGHGERQRRAAPELVGIPAEHPAAQRPHQKADRKDAGRIQQLRCGIRRREEHAREIDAERRVGVPVVPLDQIAERSANHIAGHRPCRRRGAGLPLVCMHVPIPLIAVCARPSCEGSHRPGRGNSHMRAVPCTIHRFSRTSGQLTVT